MQLSRLTEGAGRLLRKVGAGRQLLLENSHLSLTYRHSGGDGLILTADLNHTLQGPVQHCAMQIWVDETQWCRWIEPILTVPDWSAVPAELQTALAAWTLAAAGSDVENTGVSWPRGTRLEKGQVATAPDWCLRIEAHGRQLDMRLLAAPISWLDSIAEFAMPFDSTGTAPKETVVAAALIAGWSRVDKKIITHLNIGDALLLQHAYRVADGEFGLFLNQPLACIFSSTDNDTYTFTVEDVMNEFNDWLDIEPTVPTHGRTATDEVNNTDAAIAGDDAENISTDNIKLSVVVEVAALDVPLSQLATLRSGDVLSGPARSDGLVTLRLAGRPFAYGTLLDIDGWLAVKIESLK